MHACRQRGKAGAQPDRALAVEQDVRLRVERDAPGGPDDGSVLRTEGVGEDLVLKSVQRIDAVFERVGGGIHPGAREERGVVVGVAHMETLRQRASDGRLPRAHHPHEDDVAVAPVVHPLMRW